MESGRSDRQTKPTPLVFRPAHLHTVGWCGGIQFRVLLEHACPSHPPSSKSLPCIKPRPRSGSDSRAGESSAAATATPTTTALLFFTQHNRTTRRTECLKLLIPKLNLPPAHCCQKLDLEHACDVALPCLIPSSQES